MFTLDEVACLGCCSLAPVLMVDGHTAGKLTPATAVRCAEGEGMKRRPVEIRVGLGSCGVASGGEAVRDALVKAGAAVKTVGCNGMCYREPLVEVVEADGRVATYGNVTPEMAKSIVRRRGWQAEPPAPPKHRIVLENCGIVDPLNIDDYLERGGYRALTISPEEVIAAITESGLRGRGGAGFPHGAQMGARARAAGRRQVRHLQWRLKAIRARFMDRLVLESDPHRVLEGLPSGLRP